MSKPYGIRTMFLATVLALGPAAVLAAPGPHGMGAGMPMAGTGCHAWGPGAHWRMMANAPVPMLLPIVWRHAIPLKLAPSQESRLRQWRSEHMKTMHIRWEQMHQDSTALRKALLKGESDSAIKPLETAVLKDHAGMLKLAIGQVDFLHHLLTPAQWTETTRIYTRMEKGGRPWRSGPGVCPGR